MEIKHNCAVCGSEMDLAECNVCDICDWEEDIAQETDHDYRGGANRDSLNERKLWWEQQKAQAV